MELGEEEGADLLRTALVRETEVEHRVRALNVIDAVTRDLDPQLVSALADAAPEVRQAGLRLAERLVDAQVAEVLIDPPGRLVGVISRSLLNGFGSPASPTGGSSPMSIGPSPSNPTQSFCPAGAELKSPKTCPAPSLSILKNSIV